MNWEFGISSCKLLYKGRINNEALLYSTWNYIQYPVVHHMENNMKKNMYNRVTLLYSRNTHNIVD